MNSRPGGYFSSTGFTLFEVLVVVAIIAILYTIAAANVMEIQDQARFSRARADLLTLDLAIDAYFTHHDRFPSQAGYQSALLQEVYRILPGALTDPFAERVNTLYGYYVSQNLMHFVVYSIGPTRKGKALVGNDGNIYVIGKPVMETNGNL